MNRQRPTPLNWLLPLAMLLVALGMWSETYALRLLFALTAIGLVWFQKRGD